MRDISAALPAAVPRVGVFVNKEAFEIVRIMEYCRLDIAQLHGEEDAKSAEQIGSERVWKVVSLTSPDDIERFEAYPASALLADTQTAARRGGTGQTGNWELAGSLAERKNVVLAGGLTPDNVRMAVEQVHPMAVDVSSGIEASPGVKDAAKMEEFIRNAKGRTL